MTPDRFLQRLIEVIGMIKAPAIIIIMTIALIQSGTAVFIVGLRQKGSPFNDCWFDAYGNTDLLRG